MKTNENESGRRKIQKFQLYMYYFEIASRCNCILYALPDTGYGIQI